MTVVADAIRELRDACGLDHSGDVTGLRFRGDALRDAELILTAAEQKQWSEVEACFRLIQIKRASDPVYAREAKAILNVRRDASGAALLHHLVGSSDSTVLASRMVALGASPSSLGVFEVQWSDDCKTCAKLAPLHLACLRGLEWLRALGALEDPRILGVLDGDGRSMYWYARGAPLNQRNDIFALVRQSNVDINLPTKEGTVLLSQCMRERNWELFTEFLNYGATLEHCSPREVLLLRSAICQEVADFALQADWKITARVLEHLAKAMSLLPPKNAEVFYALDLPREDSILHILVNAGAPRAILDQVQKIIQTVEQRANFVEFQLGSRSSWSLLHEAALMASEEAIVWLKEHGLSLAERDSAGDTPLKIGMLYGHPEYPVSALQKLQGEDLDVATSSMAFLRARGANLGAMVPWLCSLARQHIKIEGAAEWEKGALIDELRRRGSTLIETQDWRNLTILLSDFFYLEQSLGFKITEPVITNVDSTRPIALIERMISAGAPIECFNLVREAVVSIHSTWLADQELWTRVLSDTNPGALPTFIALLQEKPELQSAFEARAHAFYQANPAQLSLGVKSFGLSMVLPSTFSTKFQKISEVPLWLHTETIQQLVPEIVEKLLKEDHPAKKNFFAALGLSPNAQSEAISTALLRVNKVIRTVVGYGSVYNEVEALMVAGASLAELELYAHAIHEATHWKRNETKAAFTRLLPQALFKFPPNSFNALINLIEADQDRRGHNGYHPYEAELFAMLSHPLDRDGTSDYVSFVSLALTSITFLAGVLPGSRVPREILNLWSDIGLLTFSFRRFKYLARSVTSTNALGEKIVHAPAFMEDFGCRRAEARASDKVYGTQYYHPAGSGNLSLNDPRYNTKNKMKIIGPERFIIQRQAYMLACTPEGTVLIRNSSDQFGRDTMLHPAYWSNKIRWNPKDAEDAQGIQEALLSLNQSMISEYFEPILHIRHYMGDELEEFVPGLSAGIHALLAFKQCLTAFTYDTLETAWHKDGSLKGGHFSKGFSKWVDKLEARFMLHSEGRVTSPMPELAFLHPDYPNWGELAFMDADGRPTTRLVVTESVLEGLRRLADQKPGDRDEIPEIDELTFDEDPVDTTALRNFLQQAGLNQGGELVLLDPIERNDIERTV
jgi:ankyrin repeat protein